jgi:hypothetical protein
VNDRAQALALLFGGLLFGLFVIAKLLAPERRRGPQARAARQRIAAAKRRASDASLTTAERAAGLREAAMIALQELGSPSLAASYARRAERLDPQHPDAIALVASTLRRAARFRALERLLWRRLADAEHADAASQRALQELQSLYEGPLRRPEIARALRRLRTAS